jgi:hypothetical protein
MIRFALLFALAIAASSEPAWACLPPIPSPAPAIPPTIEAQAQTAYRFSTDIVFGVVINHRADPVKFRVLHVYKGNLKKGDVIRPVSSHGFDAMPCASMTAPPPNFKGDSGVIAFNKEPEMSFLPDTMLEAMFDAGLIRRAADRR